MRLHVVAKRRDGLALEVDESMELLRASTEIVELRGDAPLARDPKVLVGLRELFVGDEGNGSGFYRLAARWPHFAIMVEDLRSQGRGISARSVLWDGSGWRRDDMPDENGRRVHVPIGPFASGTLLTRVDTYHDVHRPGRPRRARAETLTRRLPDGTEHDGPRAPPWSSAAIASSASGHVFAGEVGRLAVWSPDLGVWATSEPPGSIGAVVRGFRVFAADDVIAFGSQDASDGFGWLAHYDGSRWSAVPSPGCPRMVEGVARHEGRVWVLCTGEPGSARSLWEGDGAGRWTETALAVTRDAPLVLTTRAAERPPADLWATDLASTRDDRLWIVVQAGPEHWLVRSGSAAAPLELPTDAVLSAALAGEIAP